MFLPNDYESPKSASQGYMKFQKGENRFRILSAPIMGWEDWTIEKKPIRFRFDNKPDKPLDPKKPLKHFWAMIAWNYAEQKIQILNITPATIRKGLEKLCKDKDWGAPYHYDIKVTKEGEGKETDYTINPIPHSPVSNEIKAEFLLKPIWLDALFDNGDPFAEIGKVTSGIFDKENKIVEMKPELISKDQADNLDSILKMCPLTYQESVWERFHKLKISSLADLPIAMLDRVLADVEKNAVNNLPF